MPLKSPGSIVLMGSGETTPNGGKLFESAACHYPAPIRIALLETPAGFELNSPRVVERVADFLKIRLQNYQPELKIIAARKRGTQFSPDSPAIVEPLYHSDMIFMGPGSPSYAVRQLAGSLAWEAALARHALGASLVFASAATIAVSSQAIPIYEIYKVGEDPYWLPGLDLFGSMGLKVVFVPHWNNNDGGEELDTSRCFLGRERFERMVDALPEDTLIIGLDEHTGLNFNFLDERIEVIGKSSIHVIRGNRESEWKSGESRPFSALGDIHAPDGRPEGVSDAVWEKAREVLEEIAPELVCPPEVTELLQARQTAREQREWSRSDQLRDQILTLGWKVMDTPEGQHVERG